jgi:hypothetical protein
MKASKLTIGDVFSLDGQRYKVNSSDKGSTNIHLSCLDIDNLNNVNFKLAKCEEVTILQPIKIKYIISARLPDIQLDPEIKDLISKHIAVAVGDIVKLVVQQYGDYTEVLDLMIMKRC